ncbi:MAG: hypothetical protein Q8R44_10835 [Novosphingobium sp.]|nr:hypothetical protein [Novosphingobium sp.]
MKLLDQLKAGPTLADFLIGAGIAAAIVLLVLLIFRPSSEELVLRQLAQIQGTLCAERGAVEQCYAQCAGQYADARSITACQRGVDQPIVNVHRDP